MVKDKIELPLGFSIEKKKGLAFPWVISHEDEKKEEMVRDAIFTAPLATIGAKTADVAGAVAGTVFGVGIRVAREEKIEK